MGTSRFTVHQLGRRLPGVSPAVRRLVVLDEELEVPHLQPEARRKRSALGCAAVRLASPAKHAGHRQREKAHRACFREMSSG
jgi:hypothetical protein